eukprot:TRINITY_DN90751_c0_g1_i1.p1 TRINITY_DN90751_c0_g1~~TRINITY_DN90751_c0_g1_i1.p1  ORF type:complete len:212 (-),score=45.34 TRINITY_DN90751_c0_g1_i1:245-880(-)
MMAGQRQLVASRSRARLIPGLLILISLGIVGASSSLLFVSSPLQGRGCLDRPLLLSVLAWVPWPVHADTYGGAQSFDLAPLVGIFGIVGGALAWVANLKPKAMDDGQEISTSLYFSSRRLQRFQAMQRARAAAGAGELMISASETEDTPEDQPDKEDAADFDVDDYVKRLEQGEKVDTFKNIPDVADAEKHAENNEETQDVTNKTKLPAAS